MDADKRTNRYIAKNAILNIAFTILLQGVVFVRGLIVPKLIISTYGSDVNGLISSITQFLSYITLLEAGVASIFKACLYKPLAEDDIGKVSGIVNEEKRFYRKLGFIFLAYMAILCVTYPFFAKTEMSKLYIVSFILILSVSTLSEYFISLPYTALLSADQNARINGAVSIIYNVVNIGVVFFWVWLKADVRFIYLSMCVIGLLRPLFYWLYVRKKYKLIKDAKPDSTALSQRWNGVVHHIAYYVHRNTDVAILTICLGTAMVSVYGVHSAIIMGIEGVVASISSGADAGMGAILATGDEKRINKAVDVFEFTQCSVATVLFSITALMIVPFVRLYTADVTDVNYIYPAFAYTFIAAETIYCFRCAYSTVSTSANKFKETQLGAILEAVVNLALSLILVLTTDMGLLGVAIGTLAGMFTRYAAEVIFLSKNVINRPILKAVKMLGANVLVAGVSIGGCMLLLDYDSIDSVGSWIVYALISSAAVGLVALLVYLAFYHSIIIPGFKRAFDKLRRKGG